MDPSGHEYPIKHDDYPIKHAKINDECYPALLKKIFDPPNKIYYRGNIQLKNLLTLAVVGSRKMNSYGQLCLERIISGLENLPVSIISGLAYGTDAYAHFLATELKLHTIAVLGSGIDNNSIYPQSNKALARKILTCGGALASEFPEGTPALPHHFPQRNRIISGLSRGVIISQAAENSGALITARFSLEQNRDIFAVPGSIFEKLSQGTNALIKAGAKPVTSAEDIIKEYPELSAAAQTSLFLGANAKKLQLTAKQSLILGLMDSPCSIDKIAQKTRMPISEVSVNLALLEIRGIITPIGSGVFAKKEKNLGNMQKPLIKT